MLSIDELGLSEELLRAVTEMGFEKPMPIQETAIPFLLEEDRDLIGLAATGTGKTAAFGLPLLQKLEKGNRSVQGLILCPTRELCRQITSDLEKFCKYLDRVSIVAVYGGAPIGQQISAIRRGAQVIVATPGRIKDLQSRGAADLSHIKTLVLDEADEMLNMGFEEDLREILSVTPKEKQTCLFSATLSQRIAGIAAGYLKNPHEISVGKKNAGAGNVEHSYYIVHPSDRYHALRRILDSLPGFYGIVFCRTRNNTSTVAAALAADGYGAEALHGEIAQNQRDSIMARFRSGSSKIMIATDVAARGIDVDELTHVIHYELPDDSASFVHRSGRTGRANRQGASVAIITPGERRKIPQLERVLKKTFTENKVPDFKQICKNRLSEITEKIKSTDDSFEGIDEMIPDMMETFDGLNRDQLIRSLISAHFNNMIEYYKNAAPMRPVNSGGRSSSQRELSTRNRFNQRGRTGRPVHRKGQRTERIHGVPPAGQFVRSSERSSDRSSERSSGRPSASGNYVRYFVSMGRKDGIQPKDIIGFVNQSTGNRNIPIGSIELKGSFSFFEADARYQKEIMSKSNGATFLKRTIKVERSQ